MEDNIKLPVFYASVGLNLMHGIINQNVYNIVGNKQDREALLKEIQDMC